MNDLKLPGWLLIIGAVGILFVSIFFPGTIEQNGNSFGVMILMAMLGAFCVLKPYKRST